MAIDTHKYTDQVEYKPHHSALEEFGRDERKPAVLLLSALILSVLFFGLGLFVGRWTAQPNVATVAPSSSAATQATPAPAPQQTAAPAATAASPAASPRFSVLVATYDAPEKTQTLVKSLQEAGYTDVRTTRPRAGAQRPSYSVLVGRFTQDEAREAVKRMRAAGDARLKNAKVIESSGQ
jgi:SPOR domain